nr:immunoglobulin heavy chain junction region [Macaca mulatta]MOV54883.1 immunoglobulin heavy chain junction region [Macaca mulatta]MOV56712.1 immunoglobulin heavy chain junction region [Macaca mulatta]MOV56903.1 immunoglobulin heavy chain junction region [Macaca mulatta]MOV57171.1 immunoglobulin heavy chain junction region [Macaca mulatta]
CANGIAAVDYW